jgi:hypothetical protein
MRPSSCLQVRLVLALGLITGASANGQSLGGNLVVPPVVIMGLPTDSGCSERNFRGRVAKREFDDQALKITGFVLGPVENHRELMIAAPR